MFAMPRLPAEIATVWPARTFWPRSSASSCRRTSAAMSRTRGASNCCRMRSIRGNPLVSFTVLLLQYLFHGCERAREVVLGMRGRNVRLEPRCDVDAVADLLVPEPNHAGLVGAQRVAVVQHRPGEIVEGALEEDDSHAAVPLDPEGLAVLPSDGLDAFLVTLPHPVQSFQDARLLELVQGGDARRGGDRVSRQRSAQ